MKAPQQRLSTEQLVINKMLPSESGGLRYPSHSRSWLQHFQDIKPVKPGSYNWLSQGTAALHTGPLKLKSLNMWSLNFFCTIDAFTRDAVKELVEQ